MRLSAATVFLLLACIGCTPTSIRPQLQRDIEYCRAGGSRQFLDASVPTGCGPFPIVIVVHGGGWSGGDKAKELDPLLIPLTEAHFTWFSINYRLSPANRWPACYADVCSAIRWVKAHAAAYKGDPSRIGIIGYSAGGELVCLAATASDPSIAVQAVVGVAPPTDLELDLRQRGGLSKSLQDLLGQPKEVSTECRKLLHDMSAVNFVHGGMPKFLLVHGTADKSVPYVGSVAFADKLKAAGVNCELLTIKGAPHRLSEWHKFDSQFGVKIVSWLAATLNDAAMQPSTRLSEQAR